MRLLLFERIPDRHSAPAGRPSPHRHPERLDRHVVPSVRGAALRGPLADDPFEVTSAPNVHRLGHGWASDKTVDTHYTVNEGLDFLDAIMLTPSPPTGVVAIPRPARRRHPRSTAPRRYLRVAADEFAQPRAVLG